MRWAPTPARESSSLDVPHPPYLFPTSLSASRLSNQPEGGVSNLYGSSQWDRRDPRTSSAQSLVPSAEENEGHIQKRKLLVVYIHGFMGNDSSFRSFPAHVHSFLKTLLGETHVIHTKIYPRYKTYKSIDVACENFSKWLAPHESPTTDVVLVGHSMGGLLAADVVLLPSQTPCDASTPFRHRILGTVSLDAPLLGLHPGVVVSGIASLFRPAQSPPLIYEDSQGEHAEAGRSQTLSAGPSSCSEMLPSSEASSPHFDSSSGPQDPYFNPPFPNDVAFVDRGWFKNIIHFAAKHKEENLAYAAANHIMSHLEFGACLADFAGLKSRYNRLRALEDVDNWNQPEAVRVRFANYYTVSTGMIKKSRTPSPCGSPRRPDGCEVRGASLRDAGSLASDQQILSEDVGVKPPGISIEEYSDGSGSDSLRVLDPMPEPESGTVHEPGSKSLASSEISRPPSPHEKETQEGGKASDAKDNLLSVEDEPIGGDTTSSPIPAVPSPPEVPCLDALPDKESRKRAEKAYKAALKAYAQAVKKRDRALEDRQKALDKRQRKALREAKKMEKEQAKLLRKSPSTKDEEEQGGGTKVEERTGKEKPPRRRKFCMLPPKSSDGTVDPTWVEVYMEGVDEVGAHCGLFLPGRHYEPLVGDVGERIAAWVREEESRRVVVGQAGSEV
ncbi:hypothetical protein L209DRAFT_42684 [Thermothelomyces heterothallicus CBS 203.75]